MSRSKAVNHARNPVAPPSSASVMSRRALLGRLGTVAVAGAGAAAGGVVLGSGPVAAATPHIVITVAADGTGDYLTIAAGLAAVPLAGAKVFVKRGTYVEASLIPRANTHVQGEGWATIVRVPNGARQNCFNVQNDNTTLDSLQIDGNQANQTVNSNCVYMGAQDGHSQGPRKVRIMNCYVHDANGYNIVCFPNCSDVEIIGNLSEASRDEAIEVQGSSQVVIANNVCRNVGRTGIYVWRNTVSSGQNVCYDVVVTGNLVDGYNRNRTGDSGIRIEEGATNVTVCGNVVTNGTPGGTNTCFGIAVDSPTSAVTSSVTVAGNTVRNSPGVGIYLQQCQNVIVDSNIVNGYGQTSTGSSFAGISLESTARDVIVSCNEISQPFTPATNSGIVDNGATGVVITGNRITGGRYGISLAEGADKTVSDNAISGTYQHGISIGQSRRLIAHGNRILSCGNLTSSSGLYVGAGASEVTVVANNVSGCGNTGGGNGIFVDAGASSLALAGNICSGNSFAGIFVTDSSNLTITGNLCKNNGLSGAAAWAAGIYLRQVAGPLAQVTVTGNRCFDDQGRKTQQSGLKIAGTADQVLIGINQFQKNLGPDTDIAATVTNVETTPAVLLKGLTVGATSRAVAHGLGYAPKKVSITMTSAGQVWRSGSSDGTNIWLAASASGCTCEVFVG